MSTRVRAYFTAAILHITQRTVGRCFLLKPKPWVIQNFEYLLGVAARKYSIDVHAWFLAANHYHLLVTDTRGDQIPHFMRELNSLLARSINAELGRSGIFWEGRYRACEVAPHFDDILRTLIYISTNPVKDGLVPYASRWLGSSLLPHSSTITLVVERPKMRFYAKSNLPEATTLEPTLPVGLEPFDPEELRLAWIEGHEQEERRIRAQFKREGRTFLGMKRILRREWTAAPRSVKPIRDTIPTVACANPEERKGWFEWRARREADYKERRLAFKDGDRDAIFPIGTWFKHFIDGCPRETFRTSYWQLFASAP